MNTTRAAILIVIAAAVGFGIFQFLGGTGGGTGPADGTGDPAPQTDTQSGMSGMSGMEGMGGMQGMDGMSGMQGAAGPACIRYDLIDGAWTCTASESGN